MAQSIACASVVLGLLGLSTAPPAQAQAGPPFLTNDPGTPGNGNWEINVAAAPSIARGSANYQLPQLDLNFGLGERIQLTYEVPYVVSTATGAPTSSGFGNALPGIKWRFLDQGEDGWQASIFPQVETGISTSAQDRGLGGPGPRYLLPVQVSRKFGPIDVDVEAGAFVHGEHERILGLVAGHTFSSKLELDMELYDDRATHGAPRQTTLGFGGRYPFARGLIALFMAGRSITGTANGEPQFMGYFGVQILLSHYGTELNDSPP